VNTTGSSPTRLARSALPENAYQRVSFLLPTGSTSVSIVVTLKSTLPVALPSIPVQIVARQLPNTASAGNPVDPPALAGYGIIEDLLQPGTTCVGPAQDCDVTQVIPSANTFAYGSYPLLQIYGPPFDGLDIGEASRQSVFAPNLHIEYAPPDSPSPMTISAIAFRCWRPFSVYGPFAITGTGGVYETTFNAAVPCTSGPTTTFSSFVPFTLPSGGVPVSATTFDTWPVVIPLSQPFQILGGMNFHIVLNFVGGVQSFLQVDAPADGGLYAYRYPTGTTAGYTYVAGTAPVVGLIVAPPSTLPSLTPKLQILGEPMLGRTLEATISRAPAGQPGAFVYSFDETSVGFPPSCMQYLVLATATSELAICNNIGYWRRQSQITIPTNPSLLFSSIVYQAVVLEPSGVYLLSNGVRVTIGGGL